MKTTSYTTIVYSIFVFLSGVMAYQALGQTSSLVLETPLAIILFVSGLMMVPHKKYAHHAAALCTIPLAIFYGINFATKQQYFAGVLAALSAIVFVLNVIQVFHVGEPE